MRERALVILNRAAGSGTAAARWSRIAPLLERRFRLDVLDDACWPDRLRSALASFAGRLVIAAGGDGTVGAVASALACEAGSRCLGAIALGSSNDFHRASPAVVAGVRARIDPALAAPLDVVRCDYVTEEGVKARRHFVVSASVGATAEANDRFNRSLAAHPRLRHGCRTPAMLAAAAAAIRGHRPVPAQLWIDERFAGSWKLSNLSILKTPWLGAGLRYDTPVEPDSGDVAVNGCHDMGRGELVRLLMGLWRGRFLGRPQTWHRRARSLRLTLLRPALLELDGETARVAEAAFEVLPGRLRLCR